ncbi:MAG TPA: C-terminal helicase domain-containing protein, partial [Mycoplasmatales bacterium]|nr:C-terminal helicase domain-containing protein [Mycoplasmatales bacterium]
KWLRKGKYSEKLFNLKSIILYPPYLDKDLKSDGAKINYLLFFCLENTDKQIVIFSTRSDTFLIPLSLRLSEKDVNFGIIVGKTDHKKRIENIRDFQNFKIKILLCNIQSAGFGLELSSADTLIFADRCYSPADNEQAEARFIPTKDDKKSNVKLIIDLICKGTIDEKIIKLLEKKKDITSVLNTEPNLIFD